MAREFLVGTLDELPEGSHRVVRAGNREVGLFNIRGELHAIPNLCPHQRGPLCEGSVSGTLMRRSENDFALEWCYDGEVVICPWHSLEYHVPTGQCLAHRNIRLRKFEVKVEGTEIRIIA